MYYSIWCLFIEEFNIRPLKSKWTEYHNQEAWNLWGFIQQCQIKIFLRSRWFSYLQWWIRFMMVCNVFPFSILLETIQILLCPGKRGQPFIRIKNRNYEIISTHVLTKITLVPACHLPLWHKLLPITELRIVNSKHSSESGISGIPSNWIMGTSVKLIVDNTGISY